MTNPKLHHYVPQFYLRRFTNESGRLWLWEKGRDRIFTTRPNGVAAEKNFYRLPDLISRGNDPYTMEKQFSDLEGQASLITGQWLVWLEQIEPSEKIEIPLINREIVSLFIALQFLRTAETRIALAVLAQELGHMPAASPEERHHIHIATLWNEDVFQRLADDIRDSIWIFGRNRTGTPFVTSDNPVAFRTADNSMWAKVGFLPETYVVYPLSPEIIMYCHRKEPPMDRLVMFDSCLSPVTFTDSLVESENSGQVFMASRFVISPRNAFAPEREFAKTIGTDIYAPYWKNR